MKNYFLTILISLFFVPSHFFGQNQSFINQQNQYRSQRNQVFVTNILSNGLMAGIGGVIHKKKGEKFFPVFLKSFGKGCIGGAVKYTAKYQTQIFNNSQFNILAPINRAYFFLGHSITMNASRNEKIFSNYYCNFYGVNFHYNFYKKKGNQMSYKLSLSTILSVSGFLIDGNRLDFIKTLEFGQFYFDMNDNTKLAPENSNGFAGINSFAIKKINGFDLTNVVPHELVHTFQSYDYYSFSTYYEIPLNKALNKISLYSKLNKYIDFDYEPLFFSALYISQPKPRYFRNYFEFEAEHFQNRRYVPRN